MERMIEDDKTEGLQQSTNTCTPVDASSADDIAMFFEGQIQFISEFIDSNQ